MRDLGRSLLLCVLVLGSSSALNARSAPPSGLTVAPMIPAGDVSWDKEGQPPIGSASGFAPLSVTQSGVAYSPTPPAFDPEADDQSKIADLPAWASSHFVTEPDRLQSKPHALGVPGFGVLPEPAAWALILVGTAMICGALRGLIVANRRLARLRDDDEAPD